PTAVVYYNLYMGIDKQNEEIKRERSRLLEKISKMPARPKQEERPAEGPGGAEISGKQIESFLDEASKSMERKDYFLALYYADLASKLDSKNTSADIIRKEALKKVNEQSTVRDKDIVSKLFEEKLAGFDALKKEDFVAAYYAFKKLNQEHPEDREISQFLEASLAGLEKNAFFTDEVETNLVLPGVRRIVFINRQNGAERELVYINRIAKTPEGLYMYGIEAMSFSTRGEVGYHLRAPFGKYMTSGEQPKAYINMRCLDKDSPEHSLLPTFESTSDQLEKEMRYMIALDQKVEYLPYFSPGSAAVTRAGMIDLWNMREAYEKAGYDPHVLMMELLMRILNPFLFLILSLVSVCLGWSLRARYLGSPPIFTYLLVPLLPFVILQIINLLRYAHRVVLGFALLSFGFGAALTALVILEALLLVLSIVLLAGRTTE
ncbi:MAG TPA: LptF/LptG family permease, partial [Spirochaetia bacterium]|nr:LptF/LptG family permease [Spirochaetia bacterium]